MPGKNRLGFIGGFVTGVIVCTIVALGLIYIPAYYSSRSQVKTNEISLNDAIARISAKEIKDIDIKGDSLTITNKEDGIFQTKIDRSDSVRDQIFAAAKDTGTAIRLEPDLRY